MGHFDGRVDAESTAQGVCCSNFRYGDLGDVFIVQKCGENSREKGVVAIVQDRALASHHQLNGSGSMGEHETKTHLQIRVQGDSWGDYVVDRGSKRQDGNRHSVQLPIPRNATPPVHDKRNRRHIVGDHDRLVGMEWVLRGFRCGYASSATAQYTSTPGCPSTGGREPPGSQARAPASVVSGSAPAPAAAPADAASRASASTHAPTPAPVLSHTGKHKRGSTSVHRSRSPSLSVYGNHSSRTVAWHRCDVYGQKERGNVPRRIRPSYLNGINLGDSTIEVFWCSRA